MKFKKYFLFALPFVLYTQAFSIFSFKTPDPKQTPLAFFTSLEQRKKRDEDLKKQLSTFKERAEKTKISLTSSINLVNVGIDEAKQEIDPLKKQEGKKAREGKSLEFLNKKLILLTDRKQILTDLQESWKNGISVIERNITINKEIISYLEGHKDELKPVYSWKEFRDGQVRISEIQGKIQSTKSKKSDLNKQKNAEKEKLVSLQKQADVKNKDLEQIRTTAEAETNIQVKSLKHQAESHSLEIELLNDRIALSNLQIELLDLEIQAEEDEIQLLHSRMNNMKKIQGYVEKRLVLDLNDVEIAKSDWKEEAARTLKKQESLNQEIELKKQERQKVSMMLSTLTIKQKKQKSEGKEELPETKHLNSQIKKTKTKNIVLEKEISQLEAKKSLLDMQVTQKKLQFQMVDLQYRLRRPIEKKELEQLFSNFQTQKELAANSLKRMGDKQNRSVAQMIESNKSLEKLKSREKKLEDIQSTIFKDNQNMFKQTVMNLEAAQQNLREQTSLTQSFLEINSDLINNQTKVVNQYTLIISDIEARIKTLSLWKRSPKAISLTEFNKSILDAESFFRQVFWETPQYFGPTILIKKLHDWITKDYLLIMLLLILFALAFFLSRSALKVVKHNCLARLSFSHPTERRFFYLNIILSCVEFALEHFILIFSWIFIYLHILFKFTYLFASLRRFSAPYYLSVFYLLSIPVLVYLSHEFLTKLKELNKKLSFLFFAEKLQDKFILLLTVFCYSTAILIPLRSAFLIHAQMQSQFPVVILAAYSLILIIILSLFVSKDDIIKLLPTKYPFLLWLREKIDAHYYPVFFFVIGLFILSNPYIGYSNLAWYLAFALPASVFLFNAMFLAHHYLREYSVFMFMKEEDDEITDKFEYAKTYYGFFVIFSFVSLVFLTFILISRIWGYTYTPSDIWKLVAEEWVIKIEGTHPLGLIQFLSFALFITSGFLISSFTQKFVLTKLFNILKTDSGVQNTFTRIFHYIVIGVAVMLGFAAIKLSNFIFWIGGALAVGVGFALKDLSADLFAGFWVLLERPIEIGNFIEVNDIKGTVRKIAARSTTLSTARNFSIIIPNKDLINKMITNWGHGRYTTAVEIHVRVNHDCDPELVKNVITNVMQSNPVILRVPSIIARLEGVEENGLFFLSRGFVSARRTKDQFQISSDLRIALVKALKKHHIQLAQPQRVLKVVSGKAVTVPDGSGSGKEPVTIKFEQD